MYDEGTMFYYQGVSSIKMMVFTENAKSNFYAKYKIFSITHDMTDSKHKMWITNMQPKHYQTWAEYQPVSEACLSQDAHCCHVSGPSLLNFQETLTLWYFSPNNQTPMLIFS